MNNIHYLVLFTWLACVFEFPKELLFDIIERGYLLGEDDGHEEGEYNEDLETFIAHKQSESKESRRIGWSLRGLGPRPANNRVIDILSDGFDGFNTDRDGVDGGIS
jgi:hypothetical protein